MVVRRRLGRGAAATLALAAMGSVALAAVPAAAAPAVSEPGSAPTVVPGSLDVVAWDDALVGDARPDLSWVIEDPDRGERQTAYQIEVTASDGSTVWDSGEVADSASTLRPYDGPELASGTSYDWKVRVWDVAGTPSAWSAPSRLRTGLLSLDDWDTSWIAVPSRHQARTEFTLDTPVTSAVLYLAAQGSVVARVNGEPVSDEQLGATWTDWDRRALYRGVDVTGLLTTGDNALGITAAANHNNEGVPAINVMAQLEVTDDDGERRTLVRTDGGWRTAPGPFTRVDAFRGEDVDARQETPGWDAAGFDDAAWTPAVVAVPVVGPPVLSADATVSAKDSVNCCGWSTQSINDGLLVSTDTSQGYHSTTTPTSAETKWVQLDLGASRAIGEVVLHPASPTNDPAGSNPGAGFPVRYRVEAGDDPTFADADVIADRTSEDQPNPGTVPVALPASVTGRYVRVTATVLRPSSGSFSFRLAELVVRGTDAETGYGLTALEADPTPPMRVVETVEPVSVDAVAPGVRRYDFGQNYAGWVQISAAAPAGTKARMYLGEILDDAGRVTTSNINFSNGEEPRQNYHFTFAGTGTETWEPQFVYSGFRYAEVSGLPAGTDLTVRARVVHTDLERQAALDLPTPMLEQISEGVQQTQLNAMHSVPEDTPTREKKGWTGDALSGVSSIMTAFDADDLYRKYLRDIQTSIFGDGGVPSVAPTRQFGRTYKVDPAWGAAYPVIVWTHYLQEGDPDLLAQHYDDLVGWVDYLDTIDDPDRIVTNPEVSYGTDWQATEGTPPPLFHTGYYLRSVQILADIARVLGNDADASQYDGLAAEIATGINKRFLSRGAASYANGTQFANAFPLLLGIVPDDLEDQVLGNLIANIRSHQNHLTAGFVGTQPIIQTLHAYGRDDVVLDVAKRDDFPSLGYMIANGPGTVWEKWVKSSASDGTSSKDHPALGGGMEEWFFQGLAGIEPLEPGYRRVSLTVPDVDGATHAAASVDTPLGTVSSDWTWSGEDLAYDVQVPVGSTAEVVIPTPNVHAVSEGGSLLDGVDGVQEIAVGDGDVTVTVGSGTYAFRVTAANARLGEILQQVVDLRAHVGDLTDDDDLEDSDGDELDAGLAAAYDDVAAAITAAMDTDQAAVSAHLLDALDEVRDLRAWLADSSVSGPVRGGLDRRLRALESVLAAESARAMGVEVALPPVAGTVLPGESVTGTVEVVNAGAVDLTELSGTVSVDGWGEAPVSAGLVPADGSAQLPVTLDVPRDQGPGPVDAILSLTLTLGDRTYELTSTTSDWAKVSSGLQIGDVTVQTEDGDPPERAVLRVPVSNDGRSDVHGYVTASLPTGWRTVPSQPLVVPAGGSVTAEVPVVVPLDIVGGATPVTVEVRRAGAGLVSKDASVSFDLARPPAGDVLDHVDFGDGPSEAAHGIQAGPHSGTNVEAGLTRRYADPSFPGSSYSVEVAVPADAPFLLRAVETFDGANTKKYHVYVDGTLVRTQLVPRTQGGHGIKVYDLLVDDPAVFAADGTVRVRFEYPLDAPGFYDPSIADLWVMPVPADTRAPDVAAIVVGGTPGAAGWYRSDVTVEVSAADNRDPDPRVQVGGSNGWEEYVGPVAVAGEGRHPLSYRATDDAGNRSATMELPVRIDMTAPITSVSVARGSGVEGSDRATLRFAADDALSGVAATVYRLDGGEWMTLGDDPVVVEGYGEHVVEYASTDVAGNAEVMRRATVTLADVDEIAAVVAPQVMGEARFGSELSAADGSWNTKGLTFTRQWLRNGSPIAGATGSSYTLVKADLGKRISVRVTATKDGKAPGVAESAATGPVTKAASTTALVLSRTSLPRGKPIKATALVTASGARATGKVAFVVDGRTVNKVRLRNGKAAVTIRIARAGKHKVKVRYLGSPTVSSSTSSAVTVKVR